MINGIWENEYVQKLGIIDHCIEVLELNNEIRCLKAHKSTDIIKFNEGLNNEMMDLYLILEKWAYERQELKDKRIKRFLEKEMENNKILSDDEIDILLGKNNKIDCTECDKRDCVEYSELFARNCMSPVRDICLSENYIYYRKLIEEEKIYRGI